MRALRRARLCFLAAIVIAAVILVTGLPIGEIVSSRSALSATSLRLSQLRAENRLLEAKVRALDSGPLIRQIAHEQYGLVSPGERSVAVLGEEPVPPRSNAAYGSLFSPPLGSVRIPRADIVPSDASLMPPLSSTGGASVPSYWQRLVERLEFWKTGT